MGDRTIWHQKRNSCGNCGFLRYIGPDRWGVSARKKSQFRVNRVQENRVERTQVPSWSVRLFHLPAHRPHDREQHLRGGEAASFRWRRFPISDQEPEGGLRTGRQGKPDRILTLSGLSGAPDARLEPVQRAQKSTEKEKARWARLFHALPIVAKSSNLR